MSQTGWGEIRRLQSQSLALPLIPTTEGLGLGPGLTSPSAVADSIINEMSQASWTM